MNPPVFDIAASDIAVQALLGTGGLDDPVRFYSFGDAPQGVQLPYAVWRNVNGSPFNHLNSRPNADNFELQIDVYGHDRQSVRDVTAALNYALETHAHITRWGSSDRDAQTRNYHYDFDVEFITQR